MELGKMALGKMKLGKLSCNRHNYLASFWQPIQRANFRVNTDQSN